MARLLTTETREIPNNVPVETIKRQLNIPESRDVIVVDPNRGPRRLAPNEVLGPDDLITDVPRYIRGAPNAARLGIEVAALADALPDHVTIITDQPRYSYILISNLPLPPQYAPQETNVLVKLPDQYPAIPPGRSPSSGIFVSGGLVHNGIPMECGRHQYHWLCGHNPEEMKHKNWAWWCFSKFEDWQPERDSLIKILVVLGETLYRPLDQRFG